MCRVSVAGEDIAVRYQEDARRRQTIQAVKIIMKSERSANNASIGWSKREIVDRKGDGLSGVTVGGLVDEEV